MFGPWINNEWQKLAVSLGEGPDDGPKLDMGMLGLVLPLFLVLMIYYSCAPIPQTFREPGYGVLFYVFLAAFLLVFQGEYRPTARQFGIGRESFQSGPVWAWALCRLGITFAQLGLMLVTVLFIVPDCGSSPQPISVPPPTAGDVLIVLLVPPLEELTFRGYLYLVMRQNWGARKAALISSALFAAMHPTTVIFVFLASLLYVFINNRARSLIPSTAAHISFNGCLLLLWWFAAKFAH